MLLTDAQLRRSLARSICDDLDRGSKCVRVSKPTYRENGTAVRSVRVRYNDAFLDHETDQPYGGPNRYGELHTQHYTVWDSGNRVYIRKIVDGKEQQCEFIVEDIARETGLIKTGFDQLEPSGESR